MVGLWNQGEYRQHRKTPPSHSHLYHFYQGEWLGWGRKPSPLQSFKQMFEELLKESNSKGPPDNTVESLKWLRTHLGYEMDFKSIKISFLFETFSERCFCLHNKSV